MLPVVGVVLAGGRGTRLWPLASPGKPKQFLPLGSGRSLFRETCRRILPLCGPDRLVIVTGAAHARLARRQAPRGAWRNAIIEAAGRNTAASVALAALWIAARHGDAVMVILPSDHRIDPAARFRAAARRAVRAARDTGRLVLVGIPPSGPDPGLGYIRAGEAIRPGVRRADRFIEKPSARRAARLLRSGDWLWNSGIFVWRAGSILRGLRRFRPEILRPIEAWARGRPPRQWRVPAAVLRRIPAEPIDRAVLERARDLLVVRAGFRWTDVGTWPAVAALLRSDRHGNARVGRMVAIESRDCLGWNRGGTTVLVGVRDLAVVRRGTTVLVGHRGAAHRVREVAERLSREALAGVAGESA